MKRIKKTVLCIFLAVLLLLSANVSAAGTGTSVPGYKVYGYILPDVSVPLSLSPDICSGIKVEIEGTRFSADTDEKGYFEIPGVPENTEGYKIKIDKASYLTRYIENVVVTGDVAVSTETAPISIWPGDILREGVQDGVINLSDVMSIATAFNCTAASPKYVKEFDLNIDSATNMSDILLIAKYFNKASANYIKYFVPLPVVGSFENLKGMLNLESQPEVTPVPEPLPAADEDSKDYSTTNNQVEGVDEADIVQTDGEYIYQVNKNRVIVARAYPADKMTVVAVVRFSDDSSFIPSELLLGEHKLIVIGSTAAKADYMPLSTGTAPDIYDPGYSAKRTMTKAFVLDISDKKTNNINIIREVEVEGSYLSSRKIGPYLYLVANKPINYYDIRNSNPKPLYRDSKLNGGSYREIGYDGIHYFPEFVGANYMTIAGFNVEDVNSKVFISSYLGTGNNMYVSEKNIYIARTNYYSTPIILSDKASLAVPIMPSTYNNQNTLVYKFAMENGNVTFSGKGEVPGNIINQFSMDENNGYFRIATTVGNVLGTGENISRNNLYIMDQAFKITGKIEDIAPGEKIYSVRFLGDRGYMVTFKKVDPLFIFDLKDPAKPVILGKLKIPGFSDYLYPYDENHIIGFGKDAVESSYGDFAWYQGMKIALFDITDVNKPVEKFREIIGDRGTDSELLYNHKALMFSKSKNLMAFPVTVMQIPDSLKADTPSSDISQYGQFSFQGAYVYEIDLEKGFRLKGRITHISPEEYPKYGTYYSRDDNYVERAMYIDDTLYTLSKGKIKANRISDLKEINTIAIPQP